MTQADVGSNPTIHPKRKGEIMFTAMIVSTFIVCFVSVIFVIEFCVDGNSYPAAMYGLFIGVFILIVLSIFYYGRPNSDIFYTRCTIAAVNTNTRISLKRCNTIKFDFDKCEIIEEITTNTKKLYKLAKEAK